MNTISERLTDEESQESPPIVWGDPLQYQQPLSPTARFGLFDSDDSDDDDQAFLTAAAREENETDTDFILQGNSGLYAHLASPNRQNTAEAAEASTNVSQDEEESPAVNVGVKGRHYKWSLEEKQKILRLAYPKNEDTGARMKNVAGAVKLFKIPSGYLSRWLKSFDMNGVDIHGPLPSEKNEDNTRAEEGPLWRKGYARSFHGKRKATFHLGRPAKMSHTVQNDLKQFVESMREKKLRVTSQDMIAKYSLLDPENTANMSNATLRQHVYRFAHNHNLSNWAVTHQAQNRDHHPKVIDDFQKFLAPQLDSACSDSLARETLEPEPLAHVQPHKLRIHP